jgi:hypothetical protein
MRFMRISPGARAPSCAPASWPRRASSSHGPAAGHVARCAAASGEPAEDARTERRVRVAPARAPQRRDAAFERGGHLRAELEARRLAVRPAVPAPRLDRRSEAEVEALRPRQRTDPRDHRRDLVRARRQPLEHGPERAAAHLVRVDRDVVALLRPDRGKRDDRVAVRDRHRREADAVLPDQVVALALVLEDLAAAAGEDEHRLAGAHQRLAALARAVHGAEAHQQVAPQRHLEVQVVAERTHHDTAALVQPEHHQRHVEHAHQRVVADQQERPVRRYVLDALEDRRGQQAPRLEEHARDRQVLCGGAVARTRRLAHGALSPAGAGPADGAAGASTSAARAGATTAASTSRGITTFASR